MTCRFLAMVGYRLISDIMWTALGVNSERASNRRNYQDICFREKLCHRFPNPKVETAVGAAKSSLMDTAILPVYKCLFADKYLKSWPKIVSRLSSLAIKALVAAPYEAGLLLINKLNILKRKRTKLSLNTLNLRRMKVDNSLYSSEH